MAMCVNIGAEPEHPYYILSCSTITAIYSLCKEGLFLTMLNMKPVCLYVVICLSSASNRFTYNYSNVCNCR